MAKKEDNGSWTATIVLFAILGIMAVWAFITPEHLMTTLQAERAFAMDMGGTASDRWIYTNSLSASADFLKKTSTAIKESRELPTMMKRWAQDRAIATWLWGTLITYRAYLLLLYFFALCPFVIAITMDGLGVREISTHRFSAQSAMKHRAGVLLSNLTLICAILWLALPIPIPSVSAPLAIIAIGFAGWIWLSNLQKRI